MQKALCSVGYPDLATIYSDIALRYKKRDPFHVEEIRVKKQKLREFCIVAGIINSENERIFWMFLV
jgi:hypothetical protein